MSVQFGLLSGQVTCNFQLLFSCSTWEEFWFFESVWIGQFERKGVDAIE